MNIWIFLKVYIQNNIIYIFNINIITLIISEISEFYRMNSEEDRIILSKFHTERNIIENLDLQAFPVTIKYYDLPLVQTSIFKVIHLYLISISILYRYKNFYMYSFF